MDSRPRAQVTSIAPRLYPRPDPLPAPGGGAASHHAVLSLFVLVWGGNFVLAGVALGEMSPISFSAARLIAGALVLVALLAAHARLQERRTGARAPLFPVIRSEDWPRLLLVSLVGATLAPWLGIEGLGLTHAGRASLWLALGPVLSCGFGYAWRTERIGKLGYLGTLLAGLGTVALAVDGLTSARAYWLGDLLLLLALVLTVVELHLMKPLVGRYGALAAVSARTVIGGALYLLVAATTLAEQSWLSLGAWSWIAILLGGGIGVGVGQWVKVRALRALGPTHVILYGNLVPLATLGLAWLLIGTRPSVLEMAAGGLIVAGALCLQLLDGAPRAARPAEPQPGVVEAAVESV